VRAVTVVVPVKNSQRTIVATVESLLTQDYPGPLEVLLVGDVGDRTWEPLRERIDAGDVRILELEVATGGRDSNAKRNAGLGAATGEVLALTDSDMVLPSDWVSTGVALLDEHACVAGSMQSVSDDFWGRYVDRNPFAGKTPRMVEDYVTCRNSFDGARKPPVTANVLFTRELYERIGGLDAAFVHSYEDYEWFQRVVDAGFDVLCTDRLRAAHHHRQGLRQLVREYHRSGRGCAMFVRKHPHSSFGRNRLGHLARLLAVMTLMLVETATLAFAGGDLAGELVPLQAALAVAGSAVLAAACALRVGSATAMAFPFATLVLGVSFSTGLLRGLARPTRLHLPPSVAAPSGSAMSAALEATG
jgi:succinoglycan biosynthesis protein ExoA